MDTQDKHSIDDKDLDIARALIEYPDMTLEDISARVGLKKNAVSIRRNRLINGGFLRFHINPKMSKWTRITLLPVSFNGSPESVLKLQELCEKTPEIVFAGNLYGKPDAIIMIRTKNGEIYEKIRTTIKEMFPETGHTIGVIKSLKDDTLPVESIKGVRLNEAD